MKKLARCIAGLAIAAVCSAALAMNNPGPFPLGDFQIGSASTQIGTVQANFQGINAASFQVRLSGGTGGTNIRVYIQTTLDQGQSFFDIAAVLFTTIPGVEVVNVSALDALTTVTAPTDGGLADNTVLNGPLGDQFRVKVISTGTYTGGTLVSVRGIAR